MVGSLVVIGVCPSIQSGWEISCTEARWLLAGVGAGGGCMAGTSATTFFWISSSNVGGGAFVWWGSGGGCFFGTGAAALAALAALASASISACGGPLVGVGAAVGVGGSPSIPRGGAFRSGLAIVGVSGGRCLGREFVS